MPNKLYIGSFSSDLENNDHVTFQVLVNAADPADAEAQLEERLAQIAEQTNLFDDIEDVFLDGLIEAPLDFTTPLLVNFRQAVGLEKPLDALMNLAPDQNVEGLSQYTPPEEEEQEPFLSFETPEE